MENSKSIILVLPFYNEGRNICLEIEKASSFFEKMGRNYIVIAVDDGSTDESSELIKDFIGHKPLKLITHSKNLGLGAAIRSGINKAIKIDRAEIIITKDADMTQDIRILEKMVGLVENYGYDIVIASRYLTGSSQEKVRLIRKSLTIAGNWLFRYLIKYKNLTDYTSNYRVYRSSFILKCKSAYGENLIEENGFSSTTEILFKLLNFKPKIYEVPLKVAYKKKIGKSQMNIFINSYKNLKLLFEYVLKLKRFKTSDNSPVYDTKA